MKTYFQLSINLIMNLFFSNMFHLINIMLLVFLFYPTTTLEQEMTTFQTEFNLPEEWFYRPFDVPYFFSGGKMLFPLYYNNSFGGGLLIFTNGTSRMIDLRCSLKDVITTTPTIYTLGQYFILLKYGNTAIN